MKSSVLKSQPYLLSISVILYRSEYCRPAKNLSGLGMVQISQIPGNIDLWLHSAWQPQIRRIWGWLHRFWSFAIPKDIRLSSVEALRLRLPPRIEPCPELQLKKTTGRGRTTDDEFRMENREY